MSTAMNSAEETMRLMQTLDEERLFYDLVGLMRQIGVS